MSEGAEQVGPTQYAVTFLVGKVHHSVLVGGRNTMAEAIVHAANNLAGSEQDAHIFQKPTPKQQLAITADALRGCMKGHIRNNSTKEMHRFKVRGYVLPDNVIDDIYVTGVNMDSIEPMENPRMQYYRDILTVLCKQSELPEDKKHLLKYPPDLLSDDDFLALQEWCVNNAAADTFTGIGIIETAWEGSCKMGHYTSFVM